MEHFRVYWILLFILLMTVTSAQLQLILPNAGGRGNKMLGTENTFCLQPPLPNLPDCKVSFREDAGSDSGLVLSINQDILPRNYYIYIKLICRLDESVQRHLHQAKRFPPRIRTSVKAVYSCFGFQACFIHQSGHLTT